MKQLIVSCLPGFTLVLFSSCLGQDNLNPLQEFVAVTNSKSATHSRPATDSVQVARSKPVVPVQYQHMLGMNYQKWLYPDLQVGEYVRRVFEDKEGNLWFGTNSEGIARFNGKELSYYSTFNGLSGSQVTAIMEDAGGSIWCATQGGISRFDGRAITNYTVNEGLADNWVWSLYQDSKGTIWAGTLGGVSKFDGTKFIAFQLPATKVANPKPGLSLGRVSAITEDKKGNLWFGTDGGGAYRYDGNSFTNFTNKDGLCDNNISCIVKDRKGNLWFGSMNGGLSRYDGKTFTVFNQQEGKIGNNEVWNIYEDKKGNIWFSSEGFGVYRFDGENLTNFGEKEGLGIKAVQTIYEDSKGRLWIGGGGGLYRFDGKDTFFNVTRDGLTDGC
jgi:ligand-binding sensor domain-containing protein